MSTTIQSGQIYTPQSPSSADADQGTQVNGQSNVSGIITDQQQASELLALSKQYGAQGADDDGRITDKNGAPRLDAPAQSFSVNDMVDLLRSLQTKSQDQQLKASKESIESAKLKAQKNTEKQLEKIKEWVDKCQEAANKSKVSGIFGWIGKVFAFVASVVAVAVAAVATVASGGAAAPLLAVAIVGCIAATMSLASAISQELGGPELSIDNLVRNTVGKFLTDVCGVDKEKADSICKVIGGAAAIAFPVMLAIEPSLLGNMVQSIAMMAGADEKTAGYIGMGFTLAASIGVGIAMAVMSGGSSAVNSAADVAQKVSLQAVKTINTVIAGANTAVSGTTQVAQGALGIAKANLEKEGQDAIAGKKELEAMMIKLQKQMEEGREEMKKVIEQIEQSTQVVSKMLAGASDSMSQIATNMGSKAAV